jgi:dihydrofolate synthase/folylpolyglutamate synthase
MNLLGNTLPEIASQKAGIIKKNTPVVIGESLPETMNVFIKEANEKEAPVYFAQSRFITEYLEPTGNFLFCHVKDLQSNTFEKLRLDLNGIYQSKNICTVLMAVEILRKLGYYLPEEKMQEALKNVKALTGLRGRWDVLQNNPAIICDVAHNTDGIRQVIHQLQQQYPQSTIHFVLGFVKDKDVEHVLELFPGDARYYFTNAHIPRAMPYDALQEMAAGKGLQGAGYDDVNDAIAAAKANAGENDVIMICGSFFIVAEIDSQQSR